MDFSAFYAQQPFPQQPPLTKANVHASNNVFAMNPAQVAPQQRHQQQQQQQQNSQISQLQQNMFFLDPFSTEIDTSSNDVDHASYSSMFHAHIVGNQSNR